MTVIELPRFRPQQQPRPATASAIRSVTSNRSLLMLVLFLQGTTLGIVIGATAFMAVILSDLASRPTITPRPQSQLQVMAR